MGDAYPELRTQPRDDREDDSRRGEPLRRGADRRAAAPRGRDREGARARRSTVLPGEAAFRLYDTFGVPYDFIEDTAATQGVTRRSRGLRARRWKAQRDKARAQSAFGGGRRASDVRASLDDATRAQGAGDQFEGYDEHTRDAACRSLALFDEQRQPVDALARGPDRLRRARARRRSTSRPAARCPTPAASSTRRPARRRPSTGCARIRPGLPRAHRVRVDRRHAARPRPRDRRGRRRACATRRAAITRRRTCSTRRCARCSARTSSRPARSSRPIGCASTSCTSSRSRATSSIASSGSSTSRSCRNTPVHDRGPLDAGGDRGRRDGALRREVRRQGARRQRARLQHGAVRRHARQRDRRHRLLRDRRGERRRGGRAPHRGGDRRWARSRGRSSSARRSHRVIDALQRRPTIRPSRRSRSCRPRRKRLAREVTQLKTKLAMGGGAAAQTATTRSRSPA